MVVRSGYRSFGDLGVEAVGEAGLGEEGAGSGRVGLEGGHGVVV